MDICTFIEMNTLYFYLFTCLFSANMGHHHPRKLIINKKNVLNLRCIETFHFEHLQDVNTHWEHFLGPICSFSIM